MKELGKTSGRLVGAFAIAFIPLAVLAIRHTIDVPAHDQVNWNIVNLIEEALQGRLTWATFFWSHNEHQLIFTKLAIILNARLTHWYQPAETLLSAAVIACAAALMAVRMAKDRQWLVVIVGVLIAASLNQWRNVTWAFMLQHGAAVLAAVAMALIAARPRIAVVPLIAAALAGTLASGNGILLWAVGFVWLAVQYLRDRAPSQVRQVLLFLLVSGLVVALYLSQLKGPSLPLTAAGKILPGMLLVLANPLAVLLKSHVLRLVVGGVVLLSSCAVLLAWVRQEARRDRVPPPELRAIASMLMFCLASAFMIALRREGDSLLDGKYTTTINPVYASLFFAGVGAIVPARQAWLRLASVTAGAVFVAASLGSLPAASLVERLDRATVTADLVQAGLADNTAVSVQPADWKVALRPDLSTQLKRLDALHLLRPDLARLAHGIEDQFARLRQAKNSFDSPEFQFAEVQRDPLVLEAVGFAGLDEHARLPDAMLLLVVPRHEAARVTVYPLAKSARRNYDGSGWNRHSFGYASERLDIQAAADQVERVALVAVWLDGLKFRLLGCRIDP